MTQAKSGGPRIENSATSDPPESVPASERRSHRRVKVAVPAEIVVGEHAIPAALLSISLGGAALRAELECTVGQRLSLRFRLPDRGWIDFSAELVRVSPRSIGVRFLALDRASFEALMKLLDRNDTA
jgi:hypothetical protein